MYLSICNEDHDLLYRITIEKIDSATYKYHLRDFVDGLDSEGTIYNFTGGPLGLLERILNGRTVHREN